MKEDDFPWTKAQMFDAIMTYQTALGDVQAQVDTLVETGKRKRLPPEVLDAMIEVSTTIGAATTEVARKLDT
jgi:hypothetical protein